MARTFTKIIINAKSLRVQPELSYMLCENEGCSKEFRMADAWCYPASMALSGPDIQISVFCDEEQHWGCSHECALKLHNDCVTNHLLPQHATALEQQKQAQAQAAEAEAKQQAFAQAAAEAAAKQAAAIEPASSTEPDAAPTAPAASAAEAAPASDAAPGT